MKKNLYEAIIRTTQRMCEKGIIPCVTANRVVAEYESKIEKLSNYR